jgi:hypothetical protein
LSEILRNWESGLGFPGVLVIDGHAHIGEWPHATTYHSVEEAVKETVSFMDANGVDVACSMTGGYMFGGGSDYRLGNDFLFEVCKRIPDRLVGFAHVNPNDGLDDILAELNRAYDAGMRCIKLYNAYQEQYPGDGPNLMAVYEYAAKHQMLILNHHWTADVLMRISAELPEMDFIYGHYAGWQDPVLRARKNVYANIWGYGAYGWLDQGVASVGADKFLFGSDAFLNPMSVGLGPVVHVPISDEEKRLILGLTMARLLDKVGALPQWVKKEYLECANDS